ncbi:MAG: hypothetical protein LBF16_00930 [Pseudomonadales bacterium]|jgi:folate-binding protein YgfZ|nr:hypothetical protein [Pseudomonadales bacterium]
MTKPLPAAASPSCLTAADFAVLRLSGADATRGLQGQLTCDVAALPPGATTPGAALTNKGRAFALFWLLKLAEESYVFVLNQGLGAVLTAQLRQYLPFYKCRFSDACDGAMLLCVGAAPVAPTAATVVTLGTAPLATLLWLPCEAALAPLTAAFAPGSAERWLADALWLGHFPFALEDVERYTPQELRLDQHGYVSYEKGCYTGQEIVARMHYRGTVKKHLCRLEFDELETASGVTLHDASGHEIGSVFKALPLGAARWRALAFLPVEALNTAALPQASAGRLYACAPL